MFFEDQDEECENFALFSDIYVHSFKRFLRNFVAFLFKLFISFVDSVESLELPDEYFASCPLEVVDRIFIDELKFHFFRNIFQNQVDVL